MKYRIDYFSEYGKRWVPSSTMEGDMPKSLKTLKRWKDWTKSLRIAGGMKYRLVSLRPFKVIYTPR